MKAQVQDGSSAIEAALRQAKGEILKAMLVPISAALACGIAAAVLARII